MDQLDPNLLWAMLQDIGAELRPYVERPDAPKWAADLRKAVDAADDAVTALCQEREPA